MERTSTLMTARRPHIRTLNSMGQWICDTYGGQGRLRVLEEPSVRDLVQQGIHLRTGIAAEVDLTHTLLWIARR